MTYEEKCGIMSSMIKQLKKQIDDIDIELSKEEVYSSPVAAQKFAQKRKYLSDLLECLLNLDNVNQFIEQWERFKEKEQDEELLFIANDLVEDYRKKKVVYINELKGIIAQSDEKSDKNVIVEVRAGTGGDEAGIFAADLYNMYNGFAKKNNWDVNVHNISKGKADGIKEVVFSLRGQGIYDKMQHESGVHRVQRVPKTESSGRIHTSTATVAVLLEVKEHEVEIQEKDIRIDTFRASGHGGQGVNKLETAVRITHLPTGIITTCQDEKSQNTNKERAMIELQSRLNALENEKRQRKI